MNDVEGERKVVDVELEKLKLESRKVELEVKRLRLDEKKVEDERNQAKLRTISIFIPLLIAALGIFFNVWSQGRQAQYDFELTAAEVVMDSSSPTGTANRARALAALFPDHLSANFAEEFDPSLYSSPNSADSKKELIQLLIEYPDQEEKILKLWATLFPGDEWLIPLLDAEIE